MNLFEYARLFGPELAIVDVLELLEPREGHLAAGGERP